MSSDKLVISLPPEVQQYKHDIRRFVDAMVYKLRVHSNKGRWEGLSLPATMEFLAREVSELEDAIEESNMIEILLEAADVANFALIVSAIAIEGKHADGNGRSPEPGASVERRPDNPGTVSGGALLSGGIDSGPVGTRIV